VTWLASLPHQIPFRAASAATRVDDKTIEGVYVCTANDTMPSGVMAVEAMAQLGGGLAFATASSHFSPASMAAKSIAPSRPVM
jgi:hypothetical protein